MLFVFQFNKLEEFSDRITARVYHTLFAHARALLTSAFSSPHPLPSHLRSLRVR